MHTPELRTPENLEWLFNDTASNPNIFWNIQFNNNNDAETHIVPSPVPTISAAENEEINRIFGVNFLRSSSEQNIQALTEPGPDIFTIQDKIMEYPASYERVVNFHKRHQYLDVLKAEESPRSVYEVAREFEEHKIYHGAYINLAKSMEGSNISGGSVGSNCPSSTSECLSPGSPIKMVTTNAPMVSPKTNKNSSAPNLPSLAPKKLSINGGNSMEGANLSIFGLSMVDSDRANLVGPRRPIVKNRFGLVGGEDREKRSKHNVMERARRQLIAVSFAQLAECLGVQKPNVSKRPSKAVLLQQARATILAQDHRKKQLNSEALKLDSRRKELISLVLSFDQTRGIPKGNEFSH